MERQPVDTLAALGRDGFICLQRAQRWVFENERETELRHTLLAAEIAHAGGQYRDAAECVKSEIEAALDSAKIAYQMSLSDLSRDTLKVLGDLRKAITEETAKVTDATRQTIGSVTSAVAVGIGLIAARIATSVDPIVMTAVMVLAVLYVVMIFLSGAHFIWLQRGIRSHWRPRLYRFLSDQDYERMVAEPIKRAENAFWWVASLGLLSVLVLLGVLLQATPHLAYQSPSHTPTQSESQIAPSPVRSSMPPFPSKKLP